MPEDDTLDPTSVWPARYASSLNPKSYIYRVIEEKKSVFREVRLSVVVRKKFI
jgi:hypothetical protein